VQYGDNTGFARERVRPAAPVLLQLQRLLGLHVIGKALGHSSTSTTQRSAHLADDPVRAAAERVSGCPADGPAPKIQQLRRRSSRGREISSCRVRRCPATTMLLSVTVSGSLPIKAMAFGRPGRELAWFVIFTDRTYDKGGISGVSAVEHSPQLVVAPQAIEPDTV
jgi:hypothetical protein